MMVEDHPEYREGIALALEPEKDIELTNRFGTAERALRHLQDLDTPQKPDVILLDLNLPGIAGLESLPYFRICLPDAKVIILTQSDREADVLAAISAGAAGYLLKSASLNQITESIRTVMSGGAALDAKMASFILKNLKKTPPKTGVKDQLSLRELEVLRLLGQGLLEKRNIRSSGNQHPDGCLPCPPHLREAPRPERRSRHHQSLLLRHSVARRARRMTTQ